MKNLLLSFIVFIVFIVSFSSCIKDSAPQSMPNSYYINVADCTGNSPTYIADVKPILDYNCLNNGCHYFGNPAAGLLLWGYDSVKAQFNQHKVLCAINYGSGCSPMPKLFPRLSDAEVKIITCWAKNNFPR